MDVFQLLGIVESNFYDKSKFWKIFEILFFVKRIPGKSDENGTSLMDYTIQRPIYQNLQKREHKNVNSEHIRISAEVRLLNE